jgi:hypothetical protein
VATTRTSWRTVGRSWPGCFSPAVSAGTGDRARGGVKETGEAADACRMSVRLPRPTGIRNGGLLLVLVALAAVMALVDGPPEPGGGGRRLPGAFQSLPPPVGITQLPPTPVQPPTTGRAPPVQVDTTGRLAAARRHPLRLHPRPADRTGSSARAAAGSARPAGAGGRGQGGSGTITRPPVTPPAVEAAPVARVRVPSAEVRVTPPAVLGRDCRRCGSGRRGAGRHAHHRGPAAPAELTARP